ncbi:MAG TPA: wax ester/triacylglycerol synthase family O-acyltransferase [Solirubrobacteraceae bacterium]|nr:wax ester/triacylglycerol synthase family O-acyltransferase [Solirubrobacteraceae bacterium]
MAEQLSMLDTMFLELEQHDETAHMHIGAALLFDPLPGGGTPEIGEFRERVRSRIPLLPRFAKQLSDAHTGPLKWLTWEQAETFDCDAHVHHATLPAPGGEVELAEWLGDFWSHRLDRRRPLWEMTMIDGLQDGRWAVATKTHHCLVDGVASLDIGNVLFDVFDATEVPQPRPPQGSGEGGEHGHGRFWLSPGLVTRGTRAGIGAALHPRESFDRVRAAVELIVREQVVAAPSSSLNSPMSGTRHFATVRLDLAEVKAARTRLGGTVNDVVLAICAGGLRQLLLARGDTLPEEGLRAQVPVNIRSEEKEHALGNELTSLFVELPLSEEDPIVRHRQVVERADQRKAGSQRVGGKTLVDLVDMSPPIAGALLARSMFGGTRMFNLTVTNVHGPDQRLHTLGAPLVEILPLVPLFAEHTIGIAVISYAGQIVFGINADSVVAPDVAVLAEGIERSFLELRAPQAKPRRRGSAVGTSP